jgi:hypothetical protein
MLTATTQGRSARLPLVALAPAAHTFRIDLRILGTPDPVLAAAARAAAARWEAVVAASPSAARVQLGAGQCGTGTPAFDETVPDLVVFVRLDSIDGPGGPNGNIVGSAGPCVLRETNGQWGVPLVGVINLDAYDLRNPPTAGTTVEMIAHEIGHVLGIGTTWNINAGRELVPGLRSGRYDYVGPVAARAAFDLGFTATAAALPVEDRGGGGTRGAHWRERVFFTELMTGYLDFSPDPLSQITVGTLADLGWTVDAAGAEPYSVLTPRENPAPLLARGPSLSVGAADASPGRTDRPLHPCFTASRSGAMSRIPE